MGVDDPNSMRRRQQHLDNRTKVIHAVTDLLETFPEDPERDGLKGTPMRVSRMYEQFLTGYYVDIEKLFTKFKNDNVHKVSKTLVIVKDIPFYSLCEHHLLPFYGQAHVGYLPEDTSYEVVGISKLGRVVDAYARRLQMQERITDQVADALVEFVSPNAMVVLSAEHLCMSMRGIQKPGAVTVTSAVRGKFQESTNLRQEFLQLIKE